MWTNTSWPPSSGSIKPKPLAALNHFTFPIATSKSPQSKYSSALRRLAARNNIAIVERTMRGANTKSVVWSQIKPPISRKTNSIRGPHGDGMLSPPQHRQRHRARHDALGNAAPAAHGRTAAAPWRCCGMLAVTSLLYKERAASTADRISA